MASEHMVARRRAACFRRGFLSTKKVMAMW